MSIALPDVDLTGLAIGQSAIISLQNVSVSANPAYLQKYGTLRMHNESGSGLTVRMHTSGDYFKLPAGGWVDAPVKVGEDSVIVTVIYILSSPPVKLLLLTYYAPGEYVPRMTILGNSPIGGTTTTSSNSTFMLGTPFQIENNVTVNSGTSVSPTCTGVGGIPTGATAVLVAAYYTASVAGTFASFVPQGASWSSANYPILGTAAVNNHVVGGAFIVPVNTTNGQITISAVNGNLIGLFCQIYGYIF
jgi:hypothetical protein